MKDKREEFKNYNELHIWEEYITNLMSLKINSTLI
jgi:hypothetical protein